MARRLSLPRYPDMTTQEVEQVVVAVHADRYTVCGRGCSWWSFEWAVTKAALR